MEKTQQQHVFPLLLVLILLLLAAGELAAAADGGHCQMTEQGLLTCLPWVMAGAPATKPSTKCCAALAKADLACLCKYKNSPALRQLGISPKLATQLPGKCKLRLPSKCY